MSHQTQRLLLYAGLVLGAWYLARQGAFGAIGARAVDALSGQPITPDEQATLQGDLIQLGGGGGFGRPQAL